MASAFTFVWPVVESGYRWEGENLVDVEPQDGRFLTREYEPLRDHPGLFLHFADTEATPEGILQFANRYGLLGVGPRPRGLFLTPEPLKFWVEQIQEMRRAVELYNALRGGKGLDRLIRWESDDERGEVSVYYTGKPDRPELIASSRMVVDVFESFPHGDKIRPARCFLQSVVRKNMAAPVGLVELRLLHDRDWHPALIGVPRNLLGALWLQFSEVYAGKELRRCLECKEWFAVRGRGPRTRSDVQFCSVACRNRAYRGRQEQARQLHAGGKTARQIAAELGSDVKTVKGWVEGKDKGKGNAKKKEK
jgi:hypothetical protein